VRLRERFPADELPIIAMTAAVMAENRESARAAGMNDFVAKPFEVRQLEAVLRRWIQPGTCDVAAAFPGTQAPGAR
jgi:CheY-like chemotaxis protein